MCTYSNIISCRKTKNEHSESTSIYHLKIVKKPKAEDPLPIPFELPRNYPQNVMDELKQNRLSGRARTKFIASICSAIFKYKSLPTTSCRVQSCRVGEQIVKEYPFFKNQIRILCEYINDNNIMALHACSIANDIILFCRGYLVESMRDKMKNIWNVKPRHKKVLEKDDPEEKPLPVKKPKLQHFPTYPEAPAIPPGDDEASCARHIKLSIKSHRQTSML